MTSQSCEFDMIFIIGRFFAKIKGIKLTPEFISTVGYHIAFSVSEKNYSGPLTPDQGIQPPNLRFNQSESASQYNSLYDWHQ